MAYAWHGLPSARLAEPSAGVCDGRVALAHYTSDRTGWCSVLTYRAHAAYRSDVLLLDGATVRIITARPRDLRSAALEAGKRSNIPADVRSEFRQLNEAVGLTPKVIRNHRRMDSYRRDNGDPDTVTLNRLHQGPNISVTGKQHDFIEVPGHFKNVHREFGT